MGFPRINTIARSDTDTAGASVTTHASPGPDRRWRLRKVLASYAATPAQQGSVTITGVYEGDDTPVTVVFNFVGSLDLDFGEAGLQCQQGTALTVTQTAGAAAVVSNLTTIAFAE
jgi:hypothetical protein